MHLAVMVRVDYIMWLALYAVSESVETVVSPFVSNHLDKAPF